MFTKDEVAKRSYEKAEKFRRDQAAQLRYARTEMIKKSITMLKKLKLSKDLATQQIIETFSLSNEEAVALIDSCW